MIHILRGDNLPILQKISSAQFDLIYMDPPFNTGMVQRRDRTERVGGNVTSKWSPEYADNFEDFLAFLMPRLRECWRLLSPTGSMFVHLDAREVHYVKVALDRLCGRESFINEIIWAYDYGGRSRSRWSAKHDTILWYAKDPKDYTFEFDEIDRIPYLAPELVGAEKAERGKTPTDVWWHTIVSPTGKEKTGYPTQKPLGVLERIVRVHSKPGDRLLDPFAGSGSFGEAGAKHGRDATLIDQEDDAILTMADRFQSRFPYMVDLRFQELLSAYGRCS